MNKLLATTAFAAVFATSAMASGPTITVEPPVAPPAHVAYDWTGTYVGLAVGASRGDYLLGVSSLNQLGPNVGVAGTTFGLFVGRNWQNGTGVFGLELDASTGPSGITQQGTTGPTWSCNTGDCNVDIESLFTLRGRAGIASNNWLLFGTAGIAHANVTGGILNSAQQGGGSATGFVVGLGAEYGFSASSSVRLEYLLYDLGALPFGTDGGANRFDGVGDFSTVRLSYSMRF